MHQPLNHFDLLPRLLKSKCGRFVSLDTMHHHVCTFSVINPISFGNTSRIRLGEIDGTSQPRGRRRGKSEKILKSSCGWHMHTIRMLAGDERRTENVDTNAAIYARHYFVTTRWWLRGREELMTSCDAGGNLSWYVCAGNTPWLMRCYRSTLIITRDGVLMPRRLEMLAMISSGWFCTAGPGVGSGLLLQRPMWGIYFAPQIHR